MTWAASEDEDDGLDLTESSGTVSFVEGQQEANLEVRVRGDTVPELDEIATIRLMQVAQVMVMIGRHKSLNSKWSISV